MQAGWGKTLTINGVIEGAGGLTVQGDSGTAILTGANTYTGATSVSDDAARFGNYTGYDEKGIYANVDGEGRYNKDGYRLDWTIEDLGLDSRVFEITSGKQGVFDFRLG